MSNNRKFNPSYWHNPGTRPLNALTLGQVIDLAVEKWGDKEAVVSLYQGQRITFREARDKADHVAAGLLQLGLNPGDRLAIWGPNSIEWYICRLAAARGGFIAVQLDPAYQAPQLMFALNKAEVKAIVSSEFYKTNSCYEILRTVIPELDSCPESGVKLQAAKVPTLEALILMGDKQYRGAYRLSDIMTSAQPKFLQKIKDLQTLIQPDEGCSIQFSSGTTGTAKGVLLSHHSVVNTIHLLFSDETKGLDNKVTATTQFCHVSGCQGVIFSGLGSGNTCLIPAPVFEPRIMLETIIQEKCRTVLGTPALFVDMVAAAREHGLKPTSLQVAMCGGAPCSLKLIEDVKTVLNVHNFVLGYGMTEALGIFVPALDGPKDHTFVGRVAPHTEVKVVDKEGRMVPMGTPGELCVRGYSRMLGYWNDEEKTREFMGRDGWAKTGDEFVLEEGGWGRIVGRIKDVIIRIGDKVFPAEMEDFFMEHPDVMEVEVFGVPDPRVGEEICVYLRLRDGAILTEDDIRNYCKDKIPEYRVPRYIRFVKNFERTVVGKVQKFRLLEQLKKELGLPD
ncbi:medium-chain acyl-CoA ligase ACSF2, mitochondrial-like [Periplaneta americana]|uniref:medium-chain acyl-CoA ligase ACSF2, mitochondrial-like n=1 Tax=Periplaneta americana TaxID=6978 RepID=UPI0037E717C8